MLEKELLADKEREEKEEEREATLEAREEREDDSEEMLAKEVVRLLYHMVGTALTQNLQYGILKNPINSSLRGSRGLFSSYFASFWAKEKRYEESFASVR